MESASQIVTMKIYVSSTDKFHGSLLYEAITIEAKNYGIMGATVYRGLMGYGLSSHMVSNKFWELVEKVPVIIELNDDRELLEKFLNHLRPWFNEAQKGHLVTMSPTEIVLRRSGDEMK